MNWGIWCVRKPSSPYGHAETWALDLTGAILRYSQRVAEDHAARLTRNANSPNVEYLAMEIEDEDSPPDPFAKRK